MWASSYLLSIQCHSSTLCKHPTHVQRNAKESFMGANMYMLAYIYIYAQKANKESRHLHKMLLTQLRPVRPTIYRDDDMTQRVQRVEGTTLFNKVLCIRNATHRNLHIRSIAINVFFRNHYVNEKKKKK